MPPSNDAELPEHRGILALEFILAGIERCRLDGTRVTLATRHEDTRSGTNARHRPDEASPAAELLEARSHAINRSLRMRAFMLSVR